MTRQPRSGHDFLEVISPREWDIKIVNALYVLKVVTNEIDKLWDHTGTNMQEGYPKCLPSWDEFVADVNEWYRAQQSRRRVG